MVKRNIFYFEQKLMRNHISNRIYTSKNLSLLLVRVIFRLRLSAITISGDIGLNREIYRYNELKRSRLRLKHFR